MSTIPRKKLGNDTPASVTLADRGEGRRVALLAGKDERRIARRDAHEHEDADGDEERDGDHEDEATEDVSDHSVASALTSPEALFLQRGGLKTRDPVRVRLHADEALDRHERRDAEAVPHPRRVIDRVDLLRLQKQRLAHRRIGLGALLLHE